MGPDAFPEMRRFRRVIFEDFEFAAAPGERPAPVCCTALDWKSGAVVRRWLWGESPEPPFDLTGEDLYVAYHIPAEVCCRLVLGWAVPTTAVDLCVEYKRLMNGRGWGMGRSLVAALLSRGIDAADFVDKHEMQMLAARGGPFSEKQRADLLAYNERDVRALEKLFPAMLRDVDLPRARLRGRFMVEVARVEHHGVPVNAGDLQTLADNWEALKDALVEETNRSYGVWQGQTFKEHRWEELVARRGWPWPRLKSGRLSLHRDTFRRMAERFPEVEPVRTLRGLLSQLRHFELPVGADGRTRCGSSTFNTITGRNAPEAREFLFSWPKWCRGLAHFAHRVFKE
jgi:hypothetical protein